MTRVDNKYSTGFYFCLVRIINCLNEAKNFIELQIKEEIEVRELKSSTLSKHLYFSPRYVHEEILGFTEITQKHSFKPEKDKIIKLNKQ